MMNRVPPQAQTYGFPPGGQPQQRAMAQPLEPQQQNKGTLVPGQVLRVGKIQVTVERYLSEGGFAHVYLVKTKEKLQGRDLHVLKRVAVRDRKLLDEVRREVEVMKLLRGHPNIVHLHDADAFHLPDGTHEVLILMEFCAGGGIIDLLNSRLQHRLSEQEILQIFVDVCEGVAKMHSLRPKPLVHRDLKVENILQAGTNIFKLCDFGSAAYPKPPPTNLHEIKEVELDINTHTTMQYRSPEMVDVYQRRPIDEKADIWALGVFLYKLCYYTTPFEEHGPLAILNVQYRVPPYPTYSNQLNLLIGSMLQEHGSQRPSAVQLLKTVHSMRGTKSPYHYDEPTSSQPSSSGTDLFDIISSVGSPPPQPAPAANITPMRRGRPTKAPGQASPQVAMPVANPNPPPTKGPPPQVLEPQYTIPAFPLDVPAQQTKPIINVTGEKTPATAVSVSAGSARAKSLTTDSWSSFGSFKGTTSEPSPQTGTFDGFADLEEPSIKPSKTASSRTSGFSAFIPPSAQNSLGPPPSLPPRKSSSSSAFDGFADSFTDSFVPLSSSPQPIGGQMLSPRPPSSATPTLPLLQPQSTDRLSTPISPAGPTREPSFDEKYPSVEELDLRSTSVSPLPTPPTTTPSSAGFMPHVGRSYTGSAGQPTPSITDREPVFPLPRSTQVTGMAMRDAESKPQTTFSVQRNDGDFSRTGEGETVKKGPPPPKQLDDWLTGDASPAQDLPSLRPTPSPQPAPAPLPVQPAEPTRPPIALKPASSTRPAASSVIKAPRSPPVKAAKPPALKTPISSSIMSDKWSPVEAVRAKLQGDSSTSTLKDESSDEEPAAPEDAFRPSAVSQKSPQIDISLPPAQSWKKPESTFARPSSTSSHKSTSSYAPSLASANAPRRLPTFDSESASGFLRGSTTLGRASTISSTSSARPRPRPQSLYSSSSFGGAADLFTSPPTLAPISDVTTSAATTPEPALTPTSPAPMPIIAPKPQRRTSISNVAQRYDRGSPLSVTADGRPTAGPTVAPNPATQRFAGTQNGSLSSSTAPGLSRSSTLAAKRDVLPLKNVTPEANGSQAAAPAGITPPRQDLTSQEETDAEERKSVKSLISRWNKQR